MIGRDTPYIVVDDSDDNNDDDSRNSDDDSRHRIFTDDEDDSGYGDMSTRASPLASTVGSDWAAEALQWAAGSGPNGHLFALQLDVRVSEVRAYPEEPAAKRRRLWGSANMQIGNLLMRFSQQDNFSRKMAEAMVTKLCRYVVQLDLAESKPRPFEDFRDQVSEISFFGLGDLVGHWSSGRTGHVENKDYKTKKIQIQFLDGALEWRWPAAFVYVDWRPVPQGQQD